MTNLLAEKIGIDEIKKAIEAASNGLIGLKDINWGQVAKEFGDLDAGEQKALFLLVAEMLLKLAGIAAEYKGILKLILSVLK